MKKIFVILCFLLSIITAFSQSEGNDKMLEKIAKEKDGNISIDLINHFFSRTSESNPVLDMQNAQKLLQQSQNNKDKIAESLALAEISYDYMSFGKIQKSVEYNFKANALAQEIGNEKLTAYIKTNLAYNYFCQGDYPKAINLHLLAAESGSKLKDYILQSWSYSSLGEVYLKMNNLDSALIYLQRDYELCIQFHYYDYLGFTLQDLGIVQGKMGNSLLAISYFNMAIQEGLKTKSSKQLNFTFTALAKYYRDIKLNDSSMVFAKKAIAVVQNTAFSNYCVEPSKLLLDFYRNSNIDSAFKYSEMYRIANDSLFSVKTIQQTQLMTIEDELHQKERVAENLKVEEQNKQKIQYTLIALGIIIFIILYLLLSRSFITNSRLIEFLGIMALLIVFEFLNLLLHSFLEGLTNHTPILILLVMVIIAAFLIPLHNRVEKWAIGLLVEKNKKIRLANAKITIEKLDIKIYNV